MKIISLTRGLQTIVDDEDYDFLMQWKWRALKAKRKKTTQVWYAYRTTSRPNRKSVYMHREVMIRSGIENPQQCDHEDSNGLNNQRKNLRHATASQNRWNMRKRTGCSSQFKGVYWHKKTKAWMARIAQFGKYHYLGLFNNESDAAKAYNDAALRLFGDFANLNSQ